MRTDGVVDLFPLPQLAIEFFHFQRAGRDLVELLGVGAVGAFDGAVELGRARGEHEQVQAALLASRFEVGGELRAAVDLHRANGERHARLQGIEQLSRSLKDLSVWEHVKKRIEGLPGLAFPIIATIAEAEIKKRLGLTP